MKKHASNMKQVNNRKIYIFLTTTFFMFLCVELLSQSVTLRTARTQFDEGKIHTIEGLLKGDLDENNFIDEEEIEAYRLLILSYIYLDQSADADNYMLRLLKRNPGFSINDRADPAELINLYNSFRTDPIFFWGVRLGVNTTFVNVINAYGIHNQNATNATYANQLGFVGGLMVEKNFGNRITLRSDIQYITNTFDYDNSYFPNNQSGVNIVNQIATEQQTSLGFSLMGQFNVFPKKDPQNKKGIEKMNPYVGLGATARFINASSLTFDATNSEGASPDGPSEDLIAVEIRKQFNPTIDLEIGFKSPSKLNYLNFGIRYSYGFLDITDRHFDDGRLTTFYGWAANDINIHTATFFLGILIPKYSPKKLTK